MSTSYSWEGKGRYGSFRLRKNVYRKKLRSLENMCHIWALLRWWFTKRRYIKCTYFYLFLYQYSGNNHLLVVLFQAYLVLSGFYRSYGSMALLLCPLRTWAIVLAVYLRRQSLSAGSQLRKAHGNNDRLQDHSMSSNSRDSAPGR